MLRAPIAAGPGHHVCGQIVFEANESRGYNVRLDCMNSSTGVSASNTVVTQCALHHFQYTAQTSPSYFPQQQQQQQPAAASYPAYPAEEPQMATAEAADPQSQC